MANNPIENSFNFFIDLYVNKLLSAKKEFAKCYSENSLNKAKEVIRQLKDGKRINQELLELAMTCKKEIREMIYEPLHIDNEDYEQR
jgi:hypothetical protein